MSRPLPKPRDLFLRDTIDDGSISDVIRMIYEINADDAIQEKEYVDWKREPIRLFISSPGGSVYSGLALVDAIKQSKTPVYTIALGYAMSMGFWIFLSGHKRYIGENATLMFHGVSTVVMGKTPHVEQELDECKRLEEIVIREVIGKSAVTEDKLRNHVHDKSEWYIPAQEAVELKLADDYYREKV